MPGEKSSTLLILVVLAFAVSYFVFIVIIPNMSKGQKPVLGPDQPVGVEHIQWIIDNLGTSQLRTSSITGKPPEIEMVVTPGDQFFTVTIVNGAAKVRTGLADDPDIRMTGSRDVIAELLETSDLAGTAKRLSTEGRIQLEILRAMEKIEDMGYKALYLQLTS